MTETSRHASHDLLKLFIRVYITILWRHFLIPFLDTFPAIKGMRQRSSIDEFKFTAKRDALRKPTDG